MTCKTTLLKQRHLWGKSFGAHGELSLLAKVVALIYTSETALTKADFGPRATLNRIQGQWISQTFLSLKRILLRGPVSFGCYSIVPVTVTVSAATEKSLLLKDLMQENLKMFHFIMSGILYHWIKIIKGAEENSIIYSLRRITKGNKNFPFGSQFFPFYSMKHENFYYIKLCLLVNFSFRFANERWWFNSFQIFSWFNIISFMWNKRG